MKCFLRYLTETVKSSSGKNVHLEHLEDEMINSGFAGFQKAIKALNGVVQALSANSPSTHDITVKWDGAPAIVCGIDPQSGRFFVGTKSVFNVTPKLNFTNKDIDNNHPGDGLNEKLKIALKYLSKLGITGILQGDLLFDSASKQREIIDNKDYLTFQPNTIKYALDPKSVIAKKMMVAKIGIVFHTAYEGTSIQNVTARFNPDISGLKKIKDVWFDNATFRAVGGKGMFSPEETKTIQVSIVSLTNSAKDIKTLLNAISKNETIKTPIKTYINNLVRKNIPTSHADSNQLVQFMMDKAQIRRKTSSDKNTPSIEWIRTHQNEINKMFALHNALATLKLSIIHKMASMKSEVGTFVKDKNGYRVTTPEGFVAIDRMSNSAIKLVDRLDFSRMNFTLEKDWKK